MSDPLAEFTPGPPQRPAAKTYTDAQWAHSRSEQVLRHAVRVGETPGQSTTMRKFLLDLLAEGMTRDEVESAISVFFDRALYDLSLVYPISAQLRFKFDRAFRLWYIAAAEARDAEQEVE